MLKNGMARLAVHPSPAEIQVDGQQEPVKIH
jgi:hypothetical protein